MYLLNIGHIEVNHEIDKFALRIIRDRLDEDAASVKAYSILICCLSHPAPSSAGVMNCSFISSSDNCFLSTIKYVNPWVSALTTLR